MNSVIVNVKVAPEVKEEAQKIAKDMGLSLSVVINKYLRHFVKTKSITFSAEDEIPNAHLKKVLKQAEEDYKKGKTSPAFTDVEDFINYLHKESSK